MNNREVLNKLSKDELIDLIAIYAKNWLAHDGVWFQSIEQKHGMDEAMFHDKEAWRRFTVIEAKRIKEFLKLPEHAGLEGLEKALELRFYGSINEYDFIWEGKKLTFRNVDCRVQTARKRKNMPFHPCKSVGIIEYSEFAKVIDNRITCKCLSCYPDITDESTCCSWEFCLNSDDGKLDIIEMSPEYAKQIAGWSYDGVYSFYNHTENHIEGFLDGTHYACVNEMGNLVGYFCFGSDARIPTIEENVYDEGYLDVGLGLRPDMCGKGFGFSFVNLGLEYARNSLDAKRFRLSVAAFNDRAIKVYIKAGFHIVRQVTNSYFKNKFYIMTLD